MGQLKQLLPYRGTTLLQHAVDQALAAECEPVIIVVGSESRRVREALAGETVEIVENVRWESGMGSSITAAMQALVHRRELPSAIAILVADQPLVEAKHLAAMQERLSDPGISIVAAQYSGTLGVPALFKAEWFDTLASLDPDAGARSVIRSAGAKVAPFPLPEASMDIDTPEDFKNFTSAVEPPRRK